MKQLRIATLYIFCSLLATAEYQLPSAVRDAIALSAIGENGGYQVRGMDEDLFKNYIKTNWRDIVNHIDCLPNAVPEKGFAISSKKDAFNASVASFGAACECLTPLEYLEFLGKILDLYRSQKISLHAVELQMMGYDKKSNFLDVNWKHPQVQSLFKTARELIPHEANYQWLEAASKGELEDSYMENRRDDDPGPETLPGITLKRPWGSLLKKYGQLTGKKVPHDSKFEPRPLRRVGTPVDLLDTPYQNKSGLSLIWPWLALSVALFAGLFAIWKFRGRSKPLSPSRR